MKRNILTLTWRGSQAKKQREREEGEREAEQKEKNEREMEKEREIKWRCRREKGVRDQTGYMDKGKKGRRRR